MSLAGKTVLITGAAGGLGCALCQSFGAKGASILAVDIDQAALSDLEKLDLRIETLCLDLTDEAACMENLSGRSVDILINNAGITHFSQFKDTSSATIQRVMAVNFFGAVNVTKAALSSVMANRGNIVALSSVAGFSPLFGRTGYSASKYAMQGFFSSLRSEIREKGVCVSIICPSFIATQTHIRKPADGAPSDRPGSASQTVGKALTPEEVSAQILHVVETRREFLVIGKVGRLAYWANKFTPRLYARPMVPEMKSDFEE